MTTLVSFLKYHKENQLFQVGVIIMALQTYYTYLSKMYGKENETQFKWDYETNRKQIAKQKTYIRPINNDIITFFSVFLYYF